MMKLSFFLAATTLIAQDCPRFPLAERQEWQTARALDEAWQQRKAGSYAKSAIQLPRANFIDRILFQAMEQDGIAAANTSTDEEFIRRVTLDLTGRIPAVNRIEQFLADRTPNKRAAYIDDLTRSTSYVDQWTSYWGNRFEVTANNQTYLTYKERNDWWAYLRDFVVQDRSYRDLVTEMLTASGLSDANPASAWLVRQYDSSLPIQDVWDNMTGKVTTQFLGYRTDCISCHNGRGHLEKVNLGLKGRTRAEFFQMSAFFSRLQVAVVRNDATFRSFRLNFADRGAGLYDGALDPGNPGPRPPRLGGPYSPMYLTSGATPDSGQFRAEFTGLITSDRQFARAAVNYIWSYFFRYGLVDPPDGWDLARIDPANPPDAPWALQNTNPELLEALTDFFIQSGYRINPLIDLIVKSSAYQLSSKYPAVWKPEYTRYFPKFFPRRLSAEQFYDSIVTATQSERPLPVRGLPEPVFYANQLPDAAEPLDDFRARDMLTNFGRGDWFNFQRRQDPTLLELLYMFNSDQTVLLTDSQDYNGIINRVLRVDALAKDDTDAIRTMFLATLSRTPQADEVKTVLGLRKGRARREWLSDLQWAMLNKSDFWFNY